MMPDFNDILSYVGLNPKALYIHTAAGGGDLSVETEWLNAVRDLKTQLCNADATERQHGFNALEAACMRAGKDISILGGLKLGLKLEPAASTSRALTSAKSVRSMGSGTFANRQQQFGGTAGAIGSQPAVTVNESAVKREVDAVLAILIPGYEDPVKLSGMPFGNHADKTAKVNAIKAAALKRNNAQSNAMGLQPPGSPVVPHRVSSVTPPAIPPRAASLGGGGGGGLGGSSASTASGSGAPGGKGGQLLFVKQPEDAPPAAVKVTIEKADYILRWLDDLTKEGKWGDAANWLDLMKKEKARTLARMPVGAKDVTRRAPHVAGSYGDKAEAKTLEDRDFINKGLKATDEEFIKIVDPSDMSKNQVVPQDQAKAYQRKIFDLETNQLYLTLVVEEIPATTPGGTPGMRARVIRNVDFNSLSDDMRDKLRHVEVELLAKAANDAAHAEIDVWQPNAREAIEWAFGIIHQRKWPNFLDQDMQDMLAKIQEAVRDAKINDKGEITGDLKKMADLLQLDLADNKDIVEDLIYSAKLVVDFMDRTQEYLQPTGRDDQVAKQFCLNEAAKSVLFRSYATTASQQHNASKDSTLDGNTRAFHKRFGTEVEQYLDKGKINIAKQPTTMPPKPIRPAGKVTTITIPAPVIPVAKSTSGGVRKVLRPGRPGSSGTTT